MSRGMTPEMMTVGANMLKDFKADHMQKQEQERQLLEKADTRASQNTLADLARLKLTGEDVGATDEGGPRDTGSLLKYLQPEDAMRLLEIETAKKDKDEKASIAAEKNKLDMDLDRQRLSNEQQRNKENDITLSRMGKEDSVKSEVNKYYSDISDMGGRGDTSLLFNKLSPEAKTIIRSEESSKKDKAFESATKLAEFMNKRKKDTGKQYSQQELAIKKLEYINDVTEDIKKELVLGIVTQEEYKKARNDAANDFDIMVMGKKQNASGTRSKPLSAYDSTTPVDEAQKLTRRFTQ